MKKTKFKTRLLIQDEPQVFCFSSNEEQPPFVEMAKERIENANSFVQRHQELYAQWLEEALDEEE